MHPLADIEATLDLLIQNSRQMQSGADCAARQEELLDHLMSVERDMDEDVKACLLRATPHRYTEIKEKITQFSRLNLDLIKR